MFCSLYSPFNSDTSQITPLSRECFLSYGGQFKNSNGAGSRREYRKNNGKEGLKLLKVRREKWLAQIFRKDLIERKLERTYKNENNAFCLPFIVFFIQSSQYQI